MVHIIRDGRDVARSIRAQWWGPETIEEAAREWTESVRAGRAAGATPDRYRELRYEDLLRQPELEVPALFAWLGIELTDANLAEALAEARRTRNVDKTTPADVGEGKWRMGLSAEEQRAVAAVAGDLLVELGYDAEPATTRARARVRKPTRAGLLRTRGTSPAELGRLAGRRQRLVDDVVTAIHSGDAEALDRLTSPELKVTLVFAEGREQVTGDRGRRRLLELAAEWRGRGERQVSGSVYPSNPSTAALLRYELSDGSSITRALIVSQEKAGVTEITLHDAL